MKCVALFSLNDTSDAAQLAGILIKAGWDIIASKETVTLLRDCGMPVQDIANFTGITVDYGFPLTLCQIQLIHCKLGRNVGKNQQ